MKSDPAHTLALLWRTREVQRSGRGRKPTINLDQVVDAALQVANEAGLDGLSMRTVANALRVTPMTLYTYVPGKAELLDHMLDTVYLRMPRPALDPDCWRTRLTAIAQQNRDVLESHPWMVELSPARAAAPGPGFLAKYEYELSAFTGLGLDDITTDAALTYLLTFVRAAFCAASSAPSQLLSTALHGGRRLAASDSEPAPAFDPAAYPTAVRIGTAVGAARRSACAPDDAYHFGLARVLDGLAMLIN
ncbi:TetR family transcriptional regulator [Couchioplanes caeruleus subsp. azureus]|nr:TetR family transcriptional regulator [Couchioplanes caeruleus subsp. azureus]